jgi:hypothetical protein
MRRNDEAALVLTTIACSRRLIALAGRRSNSTTNQAKIQQERAVAQSKYSNQGANKLCVLYGDAFIMARPLSRAENMKRVFRYHPI